MSEYGAYFVKVGNNILYIQDRYSKIFTMAVLNYGDILVHTASDIFSQDASVSILEDYNELKIASFYKIDRSTGEIDNNYMALIILRRVFNKEQKNDLYIYFRYKNEEDLDKILFILDEAINIEDGFKRLQKGF